jgi:N-acetylneuraminate synthase
MENIKIGKKILSQTSAPYFIADIGANHDGDLNRAFKLIELAKHSGAHAAKFQNFKANKIVSNQGFLNLGKQVSHQANWKKSVYDVYSDASLSYEWTIKLKEKCDEMDIEYFTSPYDFESVDHVDPFVNLYKIGSGDITWTEIIQYIALKGKPILIAAGASSMKDVDRAMNTILPITNKIVLMQCNTNYTADLNNFKYINLNVLKSFKNKYPNTILGLSDHTQGHSTVLGSIALGAKVIEKHFTDDNNRIGPDHKFAMNPISWREMVDRSTELYYALGDGKKIVEENELQASIVQRRSIRCNTNLDKNTIITNDMLEFLRPCPEDGIEPFRVNEIIGKKILNDMKFGDHFTLKNLSND